MENNATFEVLEDYGALSERGSWSVRLTRVSWFGKEAKFDIRAWNEDMTKSGKGVTLTEDEAVNLFNILNDVLEDGEEEEAE